MKRYAIEYNENKEITYICERELTQYSREEHVLKKEGIRESFCQVHASNILEALEKYKSMTGNEVR